MNRHLALSGDLGRGVAWLVVALAAAGVVLLAFEVARRRGAFLVAASGAVATLLLALAVLRPVTISSRGTKLGAKVVVLADRSRSLDLPGDDDAPRRAALDAALASLRRATGDARVEWLAFGEGPPTRWPDAPSTPPATRSDLASALGALAASADERPAAVVVLSDGRLDHPDAAELAARSPLTGPLDVPVHTVALARRVPADASIRAVRAAGAAVAHQPLAITIEVGCDGGLACDELPVTARELVESGTSRVLASGVARLRDGRGVVDMTLTLERAGARIVEIAIDAPSGDRVADNDRRFVAFDVARDRVRVLHIAGRPTYDVRALRRWIKGNGAVDLIAFYILRRTRSEVRASDDELALIPFPVHELFTEHLPSFDAIVLQDFDAAEYKLLEHLPALAAYVKHGGGLVMVGGPEGFGGGAYAGSRLAEVLPVELGGELARHPFDVAPFVPDTTDVGRVVPALRPLRALLGDALPEMPGTNLVGDARPGTYVLWAHPTLKTAHGAPLPILALGEAGDGRAIALTIDGSHRLAYGELASRTAGRAHGALWDGLLGWLMRDPRYEPAAVEVGAPCTAGLPASLRVRPLPGSTGAVRLSVTRLGDGAVAFDRDVALGADASALVDVGALEPGGYAARVRVGDGPATRRDFACERGGDEWADSRPDPERLRRIADASHGAFVWASDVDKLPLPAATEVAVERDVAPVAPPWAWSASAAFALGLHWLVRRKLGLA